MITQPYSQYLSVRLHDVDAWQSLRSSSLLRYLEQAATDMSAATGFTPAWHAQQGTAWVMRSIDLKRIGPAEYGDELTITAWVSNRQRVRLWCEYEVRHAAGAPVAVARAEWVYIDRQRRMPRSIDPAILEAWFTAPQSTLWQGEEHGPVALEQGEQADIISRPVYTYEADVMGHTNNTIYADWLEEAARRALRNSWGYPLTLPQPDMAQPQLEPQFLSIQYLGPTKPEDTVTITTKRTESDPTSPKITLVQEISNAEANPLVRSHTIYKLHQRE